MSVKMGPKSFAGIAQLAQGQPIDEAELLSLCDYVDARLDCADFRLLTLLRTLCDHAALLTEPTRERLERTVLGFRYWMDEPGDDSMCWWSENHQLLFFTCQYLAGQQLPDRTFTSSGLSGRALAQRGRGRILRWLEHRWRHGFVEWHSNTYYEEDAAPLANLIDLALDEEVRRKATMVLDLLLADMAMHSVQGLLCASSGRCYEDQKKHPLTQDTLELMAWAFGFEHVHAFDYRRITANCLLCRGYQVPEVLRAIARDESQAIIKTSMGLDLDEVEGELGDLMDPETAGYELWAMESFTNPQSVRATMAMFRTFGLRSNGFLEDLAVLDHPWLSFALPALSRLLKPATDGVAIQRSNTVTWRTGQAMLSTAVAYHPGEFGDQQHIWQATIPPHIAVFTTHPGSAMFEDNARNFSPSAWVGNGIQPHAAQHGAVVLVIYDTRGRRGTLEGKRARFTHAWFPADRFDEVLLTERAAFGRLGEVAIVLHGAGPLVRTEDPHELVQHGKITAWVCRVVEGVHSLEDLARQEAERAPTLTSGILEYRAERTYRLRYQGELRVDGEVVDACHPRLDSPWGRAERKPSELSLRHGEHALHLDFDQGIRRVS